MSAKKLATVVELRPEISHGCRRWRRAVMRAHKLGLRQVDIAARLGCNETTIRNRWKGKGVKVLDDVEALEQMTQPAAGSPGTGQAPPKAGALRAVTLRTEAPVQSPGAATGVSAPAPGQPAPAMGEQKRRAA